ncbi:MAG: DUF2244 domain-containing protein [Gammaproteobacteria bacterium]
MVSARREDELARIVIRPNRSADWRDNRLLWVVLAAHSLVIATGFALAGAWVILPFAGLETLLLGALLWHVQRRCSRQEVITLSGPLLSIAKGIGRPEHSWDLALEGASVSVQETEFPNDPPRISLCSGATQVDVGGFLSREEGEELVDALRRLGIRVRRHGAHGRRSF